jgi:hypothetical protein
MHSAAAQQQARLLLQQQQVLQLYLPQMVLLLLLLLVVLRQLLLLHLPCFHHRHYLPLPAAAAAHPQTLALLHPLLHHRHLLLPLLLPLLLRLLLLLPLLLPPSTCMTAACACAAHLAASQSNGTRAAFKATATKWIGLRFTYKMLYRSIACYSTGACAQAKAKAKEKQTAKTDALSAVYTL